jgi:hypothetical protein
MDHIKVQRIATVADMNHMNRAARMLYSPVREMERGSEVGRRRAKGWVGALRRVERDAS